VPGRQIFYRATLIVGLPAIPRLDLPDAVSTYGAFAGRGGYVRKAGAVDIHHGEAFVELGEKAATCVGTDFLRTLKEAAMPRRCCETHDRLRKHLADFATAYSFAGA
jgi:hypothetical protein